MGLQFEARRRNCFTLSIKHAEEKRHKKFHLKVIASMMKENKDAPSGRSEAIHLSAMKSCHFSSFSVLTIGFAKGHI